MNANENTEKEEKRVLGKCPVCGRGNILKYHGNYICTEHFTNADGRKRCPFSLPNEYKGCKITDDIISQLIVNGETGYIKMKPNTNYPYLGKIVALPGKGIEIRPLKKVLDVPCPECGGKVLITRQGYACENELKYDSDCSFFVGNRLSNRFIHEEEVADYINGKERILDGFMSNAKVPFSGYLKKNEDGGAGISVKVGKCPCLDCDGEIRVGYRAFNCSNYKSGCTFNIFREYSGHSLTVKEVRELLEKGEVVIDCSDTFGNRFAYKLLIVHNGNKASIKKVKCLNINIIKKENGKQEENK